MECIYYLKKMLIIDRVNRESVERPCFPMCIINIFDIFINN